MDPKTFLQKYFKLDAFRSCQEAVIQSILARRDTLVVMPTGGGKSLCYQLPSLMFEGVTLVVSPLISLMQDQINSLEQLGIPATLINSTLSLQELNQRFSAIESGQYKLIYVAPERFRNARFMQSIQRLKVDFFAVDEAHCISQWGHDFRPDFLRLGETIALLGRPPVAAFTATATPIVQEDIVQNLQFRDPQKFVSGFSRPNLSLQAIHAAKDVEKYAALGRLIEKQSTGIVYCATRKTVEKVAIMLKSWDCSSVYYHGGLFDEERKRVQDDFMTGKVDIAVATNAFGMGIDRADIRFVAHFEMPGSLEAYYQEVGRAGRDGQPATCELYYSYADKRIQEFFIEGSNPSTHLIQSTFECLKQEMNAQYEARLSVEDLSERIGQGTNGMAISTCISLLVRARCIERFDLQGQRIKGTRVLQPDLDSDDLPLDFQALQEKKRRDDEKLNVMIQFANSFGCRQEWILRYFGETSTETCGQCDQCLPHNDKGAREPTPDECVIVQKMLSGVARMSGQSYTGEWFPRFGRGKIVQMLVGSKGKGILNAGLDKLSTYGILEFEGKAYVEQVFKALERVNIVQTTTPNQYPLLTLTSKGENIMRGRETFKIVWPTARAIPVRTQTKSLKKSTASTDDSIEEDPILYEKLRQERVAIAQNMGNIRLFMVLSNRTLKHLSAKKPQTVQAAKDIPGIGPAKMHTVLPRFIEVIKNYEIENV